MNENEEILNVDANISMNVRKDWYQDGKKQISDEVLEYVKNIIK